MQQEIIDYIAQAQKHGLTDFEIKQNLLGAGWEATSVEENFVFAKAAENKPQATATTETTFNNQQNFTVNLQTRSEEQIRPNGIVNPNSNVTISEKHFTGAAGTGFKKSTAVVLGVIFILVIGAGAFAYYQYVYATPASILNKLFSKSAQAQPVKVNYTLRYSDKNAQDTGTSTQEFSIGLNATGYTDSRDTNNAKSEFNLQLFLKSGLEEGSMQLQLANFGKNFYFNLANITQLKEAFGETDVSWIKFNLEELEQYAKEQSPNTASSTASFANNQELRNKLNDIWKNANILNPGSVLAKEKIDQTDVYRLEPQVDYGKLEKAIIDSVELISAYQNNPELKLTDEQKSVISVLIQKFKLKELKLWVGKKDNKLYKLRVVVAAPSVSDFNFNNSLALDFTPVLGAARAKSRDAKRLADIEMISSAIKQFYADNGGYPLGENGSSKEMSSYMSIFPTAPVPADGTCTDYYNAYWYTSEGKPYSKNGKTVYPSYSFTFCLGENTSTYSAGIAKLTPLGIESGISCPSTPENCLNQNLNTETSFSSELDKMTFGAEISYEAVYKDYGIEQNIAEPENALNLIDYIKDRYETGIK